MVVVPNVAGRNGSIVGTRIEVPLAAISCGRMRLIVVRVDGIAATIEHLEVLHPIVIIPIATARQNVEEHGTRLRTEIVLTVDEACVISGKVKMEDYVVPIEVRAKVPVDHTHVLAVSGILEVLLLVLAPQAIARSFTIHGCFIAER